jgi:hypothetical protein
MMGFEVRHANHEVGLGHVIGQRRQYAAAMDGEPRRSNMLAQAL